MMAAITARYTIMTSSCSIYLYIFEFYEPFSRFIEISEGLGCEFRHLSLDAASFVSEFRVPSRQSAAVRKSLLRSSFWTSAPAAHTTAKAIYRVRQQLFRWIEKLKRSETYMHSLPKGFPRTPSLKLRISHSWRCLIRGCTQERTCAAIVSRVE